MSSISGPVIDATPRRRDAARRTNYAVSAVINAVLLFLVNVSPGWESVGFLSRSFAEVLDLVNLCLVAGLVINALSALIASPRLRALGQAVLAAIGVVLAIRLLQVYPFSVTGAWQAVITVVLWIGVVGGAIGTIVALGQMVVGRDPRSGPPRR